MNTNDDTVRTTDARPAPENDPSANKIARRRRLELLRWEDEGGAGISGPNAISDTQPLDSANTRGD